MILIDTNVFVDHLRGFPPAVKWFESISRREDVLFSAITESELVAGKECRDAHRKEILLRFLSHWNKVLVTNEVAVLAGDLVRDHGLLVPDALIAAAAISRRASLITKNVKDFKKISLLKVLEPY